jgi:CheY-like chemotaxis protein
MTILITPEWVSAGVSAGWLLLAVSILCLTYPLIARIVRERSFTVEIAGFKLSAQETADSLNSAIKDLQESVRRLESGVQTGTSAPPAAMPEARGGAVLWVDDYPSNNALIIEKLEEDGLRVDRALSTREGLRLFGHRAYDIVLSDMGRREDGEDIGDAGVRLTEAIRKSDSKIPIVIYCSNRARDLYGPRALEAGGNHVTSSAVELYGYIEDALHRPYLTVVKGAP